MHGGPRVVPRYWKRTVTNNVPVRMNVAANPWDAVEWIDSGRHHGCPRPERANRQIIVFKGDFHDA